MTDPPKPTWPSPHAVAIAQASLARLALVTVVPPPPPLAWQAPGGMLGIHDS